MKVIPVEIRLNAGTASTHSSTQTDVVFLYKTPIATGPSETVLQDAALSSPPAILASIQETLCANIESTSAKI